MPNKDSTLNELRLLTESYGLKFDDKGNGHVQLSNHGCMVNYYPLSKRRTVFCNGKTTKNCSHYDAIKICQQNGQTAIKVKKKNIKDNVAHGSILPQHTNPSGIKHLYNGEKPPWEFPTRILCCTDLLRIEARKLLDTVEQWETPEFYREAEQ